MTTTLEKEQATDPLAEARTHSKLAILESLCGILPKTATLEEARAERMGDFIVTRDPNGFADSPVQAVTPEQLLRKSRPGQE